MVRLIAIAAMLAGAGQPNAAPNTVVAQPSPQIKQAPDVFFYSPGGRSYLGVDIQDVTADRLSALKLKEERGVEVTMVDQDAPAGKAGIKEHDVILEFNGTAVESEEQLRRLLRETPPGRTVTLGISRDGNPMKISVQLGDRGKIVADSRPKIVIPKIPPIPPLEGPSYNYQFQVQQYSSVLGVQTENLTRQLGEFFGVKDGEGVLVRSVEKGSAAEKAGIKAGDVIVRADNEKLSDRTDLTRILRNHRDGGKLPLVIVREKHEQTVVVELPARNSRGWWDNFNSGWATFDSDDLKDWGEEMEKWLEEIEPEIEHARDLAAMHVRSQLAKAQQQVRPQIDRAMRQAQRELERSRRLLEERQRELRNRLSNFI